MPNTPPNQATTVIARPFTGDYRKDVLIDDLTYRWNAASPVGTPVNVKFTFMTANPSYANAVDKNGFSAFSEAEKVAARGIFDQISKVLNISFTEVTDTALGSASGIRLGNNIQTNTAGYAKLPQPTADGTALKEGSGDLYMASNVYPTTSTYLPGSPEYKTLIHEIGHALGLNHPGNYDAFEPPSATATGNFLATSEDSALVSIMSYFAAPQGQQRDFFATYDLLTLKFLYGAKAVNTTNDTYSYSDSDGSILKIINDTGGTDTIDVSKVSTSATINLTPGSNNSFGLTTNGSPAANNLQTAFDATIENVIGSAQADTITGNDSDNVITGGGGNDTIDGGKGTDTAVFSGTRTTYTLSKTTSGYTAAAKSGTDGTDTLTNVEKLQFSDMTINLQIGDKAKSITPAQLQNISELYIAFFNRVPDADGLGFWIDQFKAGSTIESIAKSFYDAAISTAFTALTGFSATSTNSDFITAVYKNVLGRSEVDAAGMTYWSTSLGNGTQSRGSLVNTILTSAHGYKGDATFGAVANLLDNKYAVGKVFSVDQGITYNSSTESYSKGQAVALAVTATDTAAAIKLIGVSDAGFTLS